ncbi:MAG: 50S ribosomal protein L32 [Spirochaetaceae bacterium]|nr:50S ribosomal protein L32 [Spirochaetaceae bacterium]
MAVPRSKTSKARTRRRQSINMRLSAPGLVECSSCGNRVLLHRVCPKCGFYRGKQVVVPESKS